MENMITVVLDRYEELIKKEQQLQVLKDIIINSTDLSYRGEYMRISDDEAVLGIMRCFYPEEMNWRENFLREAKKESEKDE